MIAKAPILECEDSSTQFPSLPANEEFEGSSKDLSLPPPDKLPTAQYGLDLTHSFAS